MEKNGIILLIFLVVSFGPLRAQEAQNQLDVEMVTAELSPETRSSDKSQEFKLDMDTMAKQLGMNLTKEQKEELVKSDNWILLLLKWASNQIYRVALDKYERTVGDPWTLRYGTARKLDNSGRVLAKRLMSLWARPDYLRQLELSSSRGNLPGFMAPRFHSTDPDQSKKEQKKLFDYSKNVLTGKEWADFGLYLASQTKWFPKTREEYENMRDFLLRWGIYPAAVIGVPIYFATGNRSVGGTIPLFHLPGGWLGMSLCFRASKLDLNFRPNLMGCTRATFLRFRMKGTFRENLSATGSTERRVFKGEIREDWIRRLTRSLGFDMNLYAKGKWVQRYGSSNYDPKAQGEVGVEVRNSMKPGRGPGIKKKQIFMQLTYDSEKNFRSTVVFSRMSPGHFLDAALNTLYKTESNEFELKSKVRFGWKEIFGKRGHNLNFSSYLDHNEKLSGIGGSIDYENVWMNLDASAKFNYNLLRDPNTGHYNGSNYSFNFVLSGSLENEGKLKTKRFYIVCNRIRQSMEDLEKNLYETEDKLGEIYADQGDMDTLESIRILQHMRGIIVEDLNKLYGEYLELKQTVELKYRGRNLAGLEPEREERLLNYVTVPVNVNYEFLRRLVR